MLGEGGLLFCVFIFSVFFFFFLSVSILLIFMKNGYVPCILGIDNGVSVFMAC